MSTKTASSKAIRWTMNSRLIRFLCLSALVLRNFAVFLQLEWRLQPPVPFSVPASGLPANKVFLTGPAFPADIVESNKKLDPNVTYFFFNNTQMAASVRTIDKQLQEEANVTGAYEAWKMLRPWAYRADLWRYMILWSEGGIYMDSKVRTVVPLKSWAWLAHDESLAVCDDLVEWTSTHRGPVRNLWNGFLSGRQGSPVLLDAIRLVIRNVHQRSYGLVDELENTLALSTRDLCITGPCVLGYSAALFKANSTQNSTNISEMTTKVKNPCKLWYRRPSVIQLRDKVNDTTLVVLDPTQRKKVHETAGSNRYNFLYKAKRAYCSEHNPDDDPACQEEW